MAGGLIAIAAGALALHAISPTAPALASMLGGFILLGAGLGIASVASTMRGTDALSSGDQGLASGLLATSAQLGTALGLATIVPIAAAHTHALGGGPAAHVAGYELGFTLVAALATTVAAATLIIALPARRRRSRCPPDAGLRRQPERGAGAPRAGKFGVDIVDQAEIRRRPLVGGVACAMPPSRLPHSAAGQRRDVPRLRGARLGMRVLIADHAVAGYPPIAREQETNLFQRLFVSANVPIQLVSVAHEKTTSFERDGTLHLTPPWAGGRAGTSASAPKHHHPRGARAQQAAASRTPMPSRPGSSTTRAPPARPCADRAVRGRPPLPSAIRPADDATGGLAGSASRLRHEFARPSAHGRRATASRVHATVSAGCSSRGRRRHGAR
jgi:hypothetical protein